MQEEAVNTLCSHLISFFCQPNIGLNFLKGDQQAVISWSHWSISKSCHVTYYLRCVCVDIRYKFAKCGTICVCEVEMFYIDRSKHIEWKTGITFSNTHSIGLLVHGFHFILPCDCKCIRTVLLPTSVCLSNAWILMQIMSFIMK